MKLKIVNEKKMANVRMEEFISEQDALKRSEDMDKRLVKSMGGGGGYIVVFGAILALSLICGFGFTFTRNGGMAIIMKECKQDIPSVKMQDSVRPAQGKIGEFEKDPSLDYEIVEVNCTRNLVNEDCFIKMCQYHAEVNCRAGIVNIRKSDLQVFVAAACFSYKNNVECVLHHGNSHMEFTKDECQTICKLFT